MFTTESLDSVVYDYDTASRVELINSNSVLRAEINGENFYIGRNVIRNNDKVVLVYFNDNKLYVNSLVGKDLWFLIEDQVFLLKEIDNIEVEVVKNSDIYKIMNLPSISELNEHAQQESRLSLELFRRQSLGEDFSVDPF